VICSCRGPEVLATWLQVHETFYCAGSMEQSAAGNEDITNTKTWTVLDPAEN